MQDFHTHNKPTMTCWLMLAAVTLVGVYATRSPAPASPAPSTEARQAAARWFVDQLERDRIPYPARHTVALNKCVGQNTERSGVNWIRAADCYRNLVSTQ